MSLREFTSKVKTEGLGKTNQFVVILTLPNILAGLSDTSRSLSLYTTDVTLPGVSLEGTPYNIGIHNLVSPTSVSFEPLSITFYDDANFVLRQFFDVWISSIVNFDDKNILWRDEYVATMEIHRLDEAGRMRYKMKIEEVFPWSIGEQQLSYGQSSISKQGITFRYTKWVTTQIENSSQRRSGGLNAITDVFSDIVGTQKFSLPGGLNTGFFDNLRNQNPWIDSAYRTAGDIVSAYQKGRNSYDQLIGTGKQVQSILDFAKKTKSIDGLIKAGTGLGGVIGNATNPNTPLGGVINKAPDAVNKAYDSLKRATIKLPF